MTRSFEHTRVVVTGGAGFLGCFVVNALRERGCAAPFVPRSREYDLRRESDIARLLDAARPDLIEEPQHHAAVAAQNISEAHRDEAGARAP